MKTELTSKRWTYQEMLAQLPAESRYELRDAHLIEIPSSKPKHQTIVTNIYYVLFSFAEEGATARSQLFPELAIPHSEVFESNDEQ
jgi:Uma2 family endonuclease